MCEEVGSRAHLAYFLEGAAATAEALGQIERSARLIGAAEGLRQQLDEAPFYKGYKPNLSLRDHTAAALRPGWATQASRHAGTKAER